MKSNCKSKKNVAYEFHMESRFFVTIVKIIIYFFCSVEHMPREQRTIKLELKDLQMHNEADFRLIAFF